MALDHPTRVQRLCVIDITPTLDMYAATVTGQAMAAGHFIPEELPRETATRLTEFSTT